MLGIRNDIGLDESMGIVKVQEYATELRKHATHQLNLLLEAEVAMALLKRIDEQMSYLQGLGAVIQLSDLSMERMTLANRLKTLTPEKE